MVVLGHFGLPSASNTIREKRKIWALKLITLGSKSGLLSPLGVVGWFRLLCLVINFGLLSPFLCSDELQAFRSSQCSKAYLGPINKVCQAISSQCIKVCQKSKEVTSLRSVKTQNCALTNRFPSQPNQISLFQNVLLNTCNV